MNMWKHSTGKIHSFLTVKLEPSSSSSSQHLLSLANPAQAFLAARPGQRNREKESIKCLRALQVQHSVQQHVLFINLLLANQQTERNRGNSAWLLSEIQNASALHRTQRCSDPKNSTKISEVWGSRLPQTSRGFISTSDFTSCH